MSEPNPRAANSARRGPIRAMQNFAGGVFLLILAALAIYLARGLPQGSLRSMGPAMLPDWLAYGVGACGLILVLLSFLKDGDALEKSALRGPAVVLVAILAFAMTIRPFSFGPLTVPGLGMVVAGPLAILIGGYATADVKLRPLLILALSLTPFCMVLFGDLLNLPIPIFPQSFAESVSGELVPEGRPAGDRYRDGDCGPCDLSHRSPAPFQPHRRCRSFGNDLMGDLILQPASRLLGRAHAPQSRARLPRLPRRHARRRAAGCRADRHHRDAAADHLRPRARRRPRSCWRASITAPNMAGRPPRSSSISRVRRPPSSRPSTATRWRGRAAPAWRSASPPSARSLRERSRRSSLRRSARP